MKRDDIDFHAVAEAHLAIHDRLEQWARWVKVRPTGWQMAPMFRQYRSKAWQWERPVLRDPVNILKAVDMEKAVSLLPEKHREAIRWHYVWCTGPAAKARELGVSKQRLGELVTQGRSMLSNRGV